MTVHFTIFCFFNGNFLARTGGGGIYVRSKRYLIDSPAVFLSRCAQDEKFKGGLTHIWLTGRGMPFPLHLVSVHQTSQSTMRHLPKASAAAHTFCILGFFCHPWETAWWSGIIGICLTKNSFPTLSFRRSGGYSGRNSGLGVWILATSNSSLAFGKFFILFAEFSQLQMWVS